MEIDHNSHCEAGTAQNEAMEVHDDNSNSSSDERCSKRSFFTAIERDDYENFELILKKPKYSHFVNAQDANNKNNTPLHMAINRGSKTTVDKEINTRMINRLISEGADVSIQNKERRTVLDVVLQKPADLYLQSIAHLLEPPSTSTTIDIEIERSQHDDDGLDSMHFNTNSDSRIDPTLDRNITHRSSGTKRGLHGTIYQAKLLGLFAKRGKDMYGFRLATEMDSAGKFDDIVFTYRRHDTFQTRFLQAKHKKDPQEEKIKISDLYSTDYNNPFCLQKYLVSFCDIKQNKYFELSEKEDFTIITNTDLDIQRNQNNDKSKPLKELNRLFVKESNLENDEILFINHKNFKAEEYKFRDEEKPKVKNLLKSSLWKSALESKIISKNDSIKKIIRAIEVFNSQDQIDEANEAYVEIENERKKTQIVKYAKQFSRLTGKMLEQEKCKGKSKEKNGEKKVNESNDLTQLIDELDKLKMRTKIDHEKNAPKMAEIHQNILEKCNELRSKVDTVFTLGKAYKNDEGRKIELQQIIFNLKDTKSKLVDLSDVVSNPESTIDDIKSGIDICSTVNEIVKEKFKGLSEKSDINSKEIEEIRVESDKMISEILVILLALNDSNIDECLEEFFEKFRIVVRYPNEEELGDFIKEEIGEYFHLLNADLVSASFEKEMLDFLKSYSKGTAPDYTWKNCNGFFNELEDKIKILMTSGLSIIHPEELRSYGIVVEQHLTDLNDFLSTDEQILYIETKHSLLSAIKVLQTLESDEFKSKNHYLTKRDGFMFFPLKTLLLPKPQEFIIKCFSAGDSNFILVIEYQPKTQADDEQKKHLVQRLLTALSNRINKKIILIAQKKEFPIDCNYKMEDSGIHFTELTSASKCEMLKREIEFQGNTRRFNQIIDETLACRIVDQEGLTKLVSRVQKIPFGDKKAFSSDGFETTYYINRHFHRQKIDIGNFRKNIQKYLKKSWIFVITGANKNDLNILGINSLESGFVNPWTADKKYDKGIVFFPGEHNEMIFNDLCERCTRSAIHWLEYQNGDLFWRDWRDFKDDSKKIDLPKFVDESLQKKYVPSENDMNNNKNILGEAFFTDPTSLKPKVILLANDSGMGKSVVLSSIATKTVNFDESANLWIIRINFIEHVKEEKESSLGNIKRNWDKNECIRFIAKMAIPGKPNKGNDIRIQRELLFEILNGYTGTKPKQPDILIHFDGFDEICSLSSTKQKFYHEENATFLLKMLKNHCYVTQFWVTTRFHEVKHLEKELETVAIILNRLTKSEQKEFTNEFWKWNLGVPKEKKTKVAFAKLKERLTNIKSTLSQLSTARPNESHIFELDEDISTLLKDSNKRKTNNHLNNVREKITNLDFSQYTNLLIKKMGTDFTNVPLHLQMLVEVISEEEINLVESFGLFDLYRGFVANKINHFLSHLSEMEESNAKQAKQCEHSFKNCLKDHMQFAKELYFPRNQKQQIENVINPTISRKKNRQSDTKTEENKRYLTKCGLLKENEYSLLEFIRPTYAEYFFTESLTKELNQPKVQEILFKEVLLNDDYEPIRQFFNGQLQHLHNYEEKREQIKENFTKKSDRNAQLTQIANEALDSLRAMKVKAAGRRAILDSIKELDERNGRVSCTIFHVLVRENRLAIVRFLFEKLNRDQDDRTILTRLLQTTDTHFRQTSLQLAIASGSVEMIELFSQNM